ncbi:uncharacterized protein K441DRAFT_547080, partial [Cenococcum geophilum 1.58]|uniref:uncharacterized protein n=1 Tax=Cenococcum geophilum 1.58 TaxID=794803 RepID=UPI00358F66D2
LCLCRTCQKLDGWPYSCNQIIPKADLNITKEAPSVYACTGASEKPVQCFYCGDYTSHTYHHQAAMPDKVIVRTLLLDQGKDLPVGGEIFAEGRL